MTKLLTTYSGFKLAFRIGDSFAVTVAPKINPEVSSVALHALKGVAHVDALTRDVKAFGVNGALYTTI